MKRSSLAWVLVLASFAACEKSGTSSKASGKLSADESALLADLPKGNTALFGGNYMKFQKYLQSSPLATLMSTLDKASPGVSEWTNCFVDAQGLTMFGAVKLASGGMEMRMVTKGIGLDFIEKCAKKAGFPVTIDPDKKFIGLEMKSAMGPIQLGYLVLADGALYNRQAFPLGRAMTAPPSVSRATLETDVAALSSGTAAQDTALVAELDHVDRSKALWFVGTGAGTPAADKVGIVYGTIDIANGLSFDVTAQLEDSALATKIADGVPEMKKQAKSLGGDLGAVVEQLKLDRDGDKLHFMLALDNAQLAAVIKQLGPFLGR
jgi:hypothetical protein